MKSEKLNGGKFIYNVIYAFAAQIISLLLSVVVSLVLPKILSVENYSYWQLFLFYAGYIGFFHFGMADGIYLRLGGKKYDELDFKLLHGEFLLLSFSQLLITALIVLCSVIFIEDSARRMVLCMVGLYVPLTNLCYFFGYIFQAVNETKYYSLSIILDKIIAIIIIPALMVGKVSDFEIYVLVYIISKLIATIYCCYKGKRVLKEKSTISGKVLKDTLENISVGMVLLLSNLASMLVIGLGRMIIDQVWGIKTFGQISLAISLINFILQFIYQVGMVLFPALKGITEEEIVFIFKDLQHLLGLFLLGAMILYVPVKLFVSCWLPEYNESIMYLSLLMPICFFDGKMNVVGNTYLKILRKEKVLLAVNVVSLIFCGVWSLIGGYILRSMYFIVLGMIVTVAFRSIIAEYIIVRELKIKINKQVWMELLLIGIFIICATTDKLQFMLIYISVYIIYAWINRNKWIILLKHRG